jgi:hypothetical protein
MKNPWMRLAAVTLASLVAAGAAYAGSVSTDILISGKRIVVKDNTKPVKRSAVVISKDGNLNVTGLDPVVGGATFYLIDPFPGQTSSTFQLPASGWSSKNGKYTYVDKKLVNGPVKRAKLKNGFLKLVLKGSAIDFPVLGVAPLEQVGGVLELSTAFATVKICFLFPGSQGTVKKDSPTKGIFKAIDAEAPGDCPAIIN